MTIDEAVREFEIFTHHFARLHCLAAGLTEQEIAVASDEAWKRKEAKRREWELKGHPMFGGGGSW